jgi:hypothetical protein
MRWWTMLCVMAALGAAVVAPCQTNLLTNPGFEEMDGETGFPTGWKQVYWSNPKGTIVASDQARTGGRSVMLQGMPREQITDAGKQNNHLVGQTVEGIRGVRRLVLTAQFRTEGDGAAQLSMMTSDAEGNRLQYSSTTHYRQQPEWGEIRWAFATAPETDGLVIYLRNGGEGTVFYDDISLTSSEDALDSGAATATVDALIGGRVMSFSTPEAGGERTVWRGVHPGGLTNVIVPGDAYPGQLRDVPWELEVLEPNRRLLLTHRATHPDLAGLVFAKTLAMPEGSATLAVTLAVRNEGEQARELRLRTQEVLAPGHSLLTWPTATGLRVYRHPHQSIKRDMLLDGLAGDWVAATTADGSGMVVQFDEGLAEKGGAYLSHELDTLEVYYRSVEIAPGGEWEMSYSVTAIAGAGGVVHVDDEIAVSLDPLELGAERDYAAILHSMGAGVQREMTMLGTMAAGGVEGFEDTFTATPLSPSRVGLPWANLGITQVELRVEGLDEPIVIAQETLDDSPLMELPQPPDQVTRYPALEGFYPYGEYYRGYLPELAPADQYRRDQLDLYRRSYFNTWLVGENIPLNQFAETGKSAIADEMRERDMRLFLRGEFLRVFETTEDGNRREVYPGDYTRETAIERILQKGISLETRREFAEEFGDVILAYDVSDEPGPQLIPNYMMIQSLFNEIDPHHPAVTILNFSRTEFLPYMPVYYGDEYPIRRTGRNPWMVMDVVQFASQRTPGPVWIMLQAFGGRPEYTWQLPTGPEMRLMLWGSIAGGCKGITFHGSYSPPNWRYNKYYFTTAIDSFQATTPCWDAMVDVAREITAIGPSMLDCRVDTSGAFTAECEQLENYRERYNGPAVRLGVLRQPGPDGGRFLVAVNQDLDEARTVRLVADAEQIDAAAMLVGLQALAAPAPARAGAELTLEPGDGRILFAGTSEQVAEVVAATQAGHQANLRQIFRMDAEVARANGVDVAAAEALAEQGRVQDAILALEQAEGVEALAACARGLDEVQALLTPMAQVFRDEWDVVVPEADRQGVAEMAVWRNTQDPRMQQYSDEVAQAFIDRILLARRMKAGEAAQITGEVEALVERARRLNVEATEYAKAKAGQG